MDQAEIANHINGMVEAEGFPDLLTTAGFATPRRIQAGQPVNLSTTVGNTGVYNGASHNIGGWVAGGNGLSVSAGSYIQFNPKTSIGNVQIKHEVKDGLTDGVSRTSVWSVNDPSIEYRHIASSPNVTLIIKHVVTDTDGIIEQLQAVQLEDFYPFNKRVPKAVIKKLLSMVALSKMEKAWLITELARVRGVNTNSSNTTP